jgi:fatty acid desaturase
MEYKRMTKSNDLLAFFSLMLRVIIQVALVYVSLRASNEKMWILFGFLLMINGGFWAFWGWGGIGHEFYHRTFFTKNRFNDICFGICGLITWSNFGYFAASHKRHHLQTLQKDDPEDLSERFLTKAETITLLTVDLPGLSRRIRVLSRNAIGIVPHDKLVSLRPSEKKRIIRSARIILVGHTIYILYVLIVLKSFTILLTTSFAPWIFQLPNVILQRLQHLNGKRGSENIFESTHTLALPRAFAWVYANMNFHVEHHLYPFVPSYRLPAIHNSIKSNHLQGGSLLAGFTDVHDHVKASQLK